MPMTFSQPDDAARLVRHGVAESISPNRFTSRRLAAALRRLLGSMQVEANCRRLARQFAADMTGDDSFSQICEHLEAALGRQPAEHQTSHSSYELAAAE